MRVQHSISLHLVTAISLATLFGLFLSSEKTEAKDFNPDNPLNAPAPVYWCASKTPDQQISTKKGSGCQPLYDEEAENSFQQKARAQGFDLPEREPIKIVELQNAASQFADRYRNFLSCCTTDENATTSITDLIDEANSPCSGSSQILRRLRLRTSILITPSTHPLQCTGAHPRRPINRFRQSKVQAVSLSTTSRQKNRFEKARGNRATIFRIATQ